MNLDDRAARAASTVHRQADQTDLHSLYSRITADDRRRWLVPAVALVAAAGLAVVVAVAVLPGTPGEVRVDDPLAPVATPPDDEPDDPVDDEPVDDETVDTPDEPDEQTRTEEPADTLDEGAWSLQTSAALASAGEDRMDAVAHLDGTVVAVGRYDNGPGIWRFADEDGWQQVGAELCGEASCVLADVVVSNGRFVIVGELDSLAKVWVSPDDGRSWDRVDLELTLDDGPGGPAALTAVADHGGGLVAFGSQEGAEGGSRPIVLASGDGTTWAQQPVDFSFEEAGAHVVDAVADRDGNVLAVGYVGDGTALFEQADGVWTSRSLVDQDAEFSGISTVVESLTRGPDDELLLAGWAAGTDGDDGRVWRSLDDGQTWQRMDGALDGPGAQRLAAVVFAGGELFAAGHVDDGSGPAAAVWVLTGDQWEPSASLAAGTGVGAAVPTGADTAVAVGTQSGDGSTDAAVWRFEAGR